MSRRHPKRKIDEYPKMGSPDAEFFKWLFAGWSKTEGVITLILAALLIWATN